jgi:hypothetical protein
MNQNNQQSNQQQIQLRITDEVLKGAYANTALISHNQEEFVLDFMNIYPAQQQGIINSRVIVSPQHIKRIITAMQDNIKNYEDRFGKIPDAAGPQHNFGFRTE